MKVAIVVLNWNGRALLEEFLPSVVRYSPEAEVIVADNASTDDSVSWLQENFPQVQIIQNEKNAGYAGGYNLALKNLDQDIFILLNSDVEVTEGWLSPIIRIFESDEKVAAVQPKLLDYKNRGYFEYAGAAGGFIDKFGYAFCRGRIFESLEKDSGQYNEDAEIFWASGACLAIRKTAFYEAGGLDEDFFAHQEEIDLCWRLKNLGYKIKCCGNSRVYHLGGATLSNMNPQKTYFNFRNNLFLLLKNLPARNLIPVIFARMILDGLAAFRFLFKGQFPHFFAVFRAHISFYSAALAMWRKQKGLSKSANYYAIRSIVFAYFLQQKKEFRKLRENY